MAKQSQNRKGNGGTKRLSLNLPASLVSELQVDSEQRQQSITTHVRGSLALSKVIYDETAKGHKIAIVDSAGKQLKELIVPR